MSLPTSTDRADAILLPLFGEADDPAAWGFMDCQYLADHGLLDKSLMEQHTDDGRMIPFPSPENLARALDIVESLNMRGVYAHWLRDHGALVVCPPWCIADHPRKAILDPSIGSEATYHVATSQGLGLNGRDDVRVEAGVWEHVLDDSPAATVSLQASTDLTSAQARRVAALLLDAADTLDRIA